MKNIVRIVLIVSIVTLPPTASASWFSDLTGVDVNVAEGTVHVDIPTPQQIPERIEHAVNTLPAAIEGAVRDIFNPAGAGLATAIRHARAQASHGARPIPQAVREQLAGIVPEHVLNDVRWNSLDTNRIDLANLTLLHNESTAAITVGNIIVFDRLEDAETNWFLWSHELFHTIQYSNMGIEAFAHAYIISASDLETPAENFARMVQSRVAARQNGEPVSQIRYSAPASGGNERYFNRIQAAMQEYAPASACLDIDDNGGSPTVSNVCNTPVYVHSYVEVDRFTGQSFPGRCTPMPGITCDISPGMTLPVITPRRGCVSEVRFSFFSGGRNAERSVWEGDCSDAGTVVDTPPEVGQSCCMFNGGRCGPFTSQPAYPIGSPCSCQYGNPAASGQVCRP